MCEKWEGQSEEQRAKGVPHWEGSYTVEAAAVIPVLFFVLAALMICAFYVHDRGIFQSMACETCAAGNNFITDKERKEAVTAVKNQANENRFLGSRLISANVSCGKSVVNTSYSATYPVPGMIMKFYTGNRLSIRKRWSSQLPNPAKTIWTIRGAERIINGGAQ